MSCGQGHATTRGPIAVAYHKTTARLARCMQIVHHPHHERILTSQPVWCVRPAIAVGPLAGRMQSPTRKPIKTRIKRKQLDARALFN